MSGHSHVFADELPPDRTYPDGTTKTVTVNARERSGPARDACLAEYGPTCGVCSLNFHDAYGPDFAGLIHVHHLHPVALGQRETNPKIDLVPVCPNCHAMLHFGRPWDSPRGVDELKHVVRTRS